MVEVTYEQFHATVGQMNVHPRSEPDASYWETPYRELMGKTLPGYRDRGPKRYFVQLKLVKNVDQTVIKDDVVPSAIRRAA